VCQGRFLFLSKSFIDDRFEEIEFMKQMNVTDNEMMKRVKYSASVVGSVMNDVNNAIMIKIMKYIITSFYFIIYEFLLRVNGN